MLAGGLARFCQGDMVDVKIVTGEVVFGEDALTDLTGIVDGAFGQEDCHLTEFRIRALTY